jgi:putative solute:sodium symporter small subunit
MTNSASPTNSKSNYWRANLSITFKILIIWFLVSFGCGIMFKEELDQFSLGGAPLGFWMAQQGSIIGFVVLLIIYSFLMNKLDQKHGYEEEGK